MIPTRLLLDWQPHAPWPTEDQVEQDLILTRLLVTLFADEEAASMLAFRGGTALHKLVFAEPGRYSEDLDLVQRQPGPIKPVLEVVQPMIEALLGKANVELRRDGVRLTWRYEAEASGTRRRIKVEINTREHESFDTMVAVPVSCETRWFSGRANVISYTPVELLATKMRALYQRKDVRRFELTRNVSLELLDGLAVLALRTGGACYFTVPNELFDLDFPTHTDRRIQGVTISVNVLGGPKAGVTGLLTLASDATKVIALSSGQNDSGLFQFDLKDPRYLPFEGTNFPASWKLELTGSDGLAPAAFDWTIITDVTLTFRYTAKAGGSGTLADTRTALNLLPGGRLPSTSQFDAPFAAPSGLQRVFSAKRHFAEAWDLTLAAASTGPTTPFAFSTTVEPTQFPYFAQAGTITVGSIRLYLVMSDPPEVPVGTDSGPVGAVSLGSGVGTPAWNGTAGAPVPKLISALTSATALAPGDTLTVEHFTLTNAAFSRLDDMIIVVEYELSA